MGIYISMEMPKRGEMLVVLPDGTAQRVLQGIREPLAVGIAIPVPDHGALIEQDKILDVWKSDPHPASMKTLVQAIWKTPIVLQADFAKGNNVPDKEEA